MKGLFLGALAVGAITIIAIITYQGTKKYYSNSKEKNEVSLSDSGDEISEDGDLIEQRTNTAVTISDRHKKAEEVISDALGNIFNDNNKEDAVASENESDFDDILDKLNELSE